MSKTHILQGESLRGSYWSNGNRSPVGYSAEYIDAEGKLRTGTFPTASRAAAWIREKIGPCKEGSG